MTESIGDRMKSNYESMTDFKLIKRMPTIIRLDGKCFHSVTKNCQKPFDNVFMERMTMAAAHVTNEIQGFKLAYVQSDEVSILLTDYDTLQTQGWFDYELRKIISISAAIMSAEFSYYFQKYSNGKRCYFDSRAFNIPREEVINYFLWRALDWQRNSIQMYTRSFFSHKECLNKNQAQLHNMLHSINKNWSIDLTEQQKNGSWILNNDTIRYDVLPKYDEIKNIIPIEVFNPENIYEV